MTHSEIAAILGCSKTKVKLIEQRALEKLAVALGLPPRRRPQWMHTFLGRHSRATVKQEYHCSRCGAEGHSRRSCAA